MAAANRTRRPSVERTCERRECGAVFWAWPATIAVGRGRFCSSACAYAARQREVPPCARCGEPTDLGSKGRPYKTCLACQAATQQPRPCARQECDRSIGPDKPAKQRYCSLRCASWDLHGVQQRRCASCGELFTASPSAVLKGGGKYHSPACYHESLRREELRTCKRVSCSKQFRVKPSEAKRAKRPREYCSMRCKYPGGGKQWAPCGYRSCKSGRYVFPSDIKAGKGKYCGKHRYAGRTQAVVKRCAGPGCLRRITVPPHRPRRQYCTRACYHNDRHRERECRTCGALFRRPKWRGGQFCKPACRNQGRHRSRAPDVTRRIRLMMKWHAEGLTAPQIRDRLLALGDEWAAATPSVAHAAIRQAISRERRRLEKQVSTRAERDGRAVELATAGLTVAAIVRQMRDERPETWGGVYPALVRALLDRAGVKPTRATHELSHSASSVPESV